MSMKVDYTTPLTKEERGYLEARGLTNEIQRADALNGVETPEFGAGDGTGPRLVELMTSEQRASEAARLRERLAQIEGTDASESDDEASGDVAPYEEWSVEALKAEIDARNEGREGDAKLAKTGNVKTLADRMYQDDEDQAAQTV